MYQRLIILLIVLGSYVNSQTCDLAVVRTCQSLLCSEASRACRLPSGDPKMIFCPVSCAECYERGSYCHSEPGSLVMHHTRVQCGPGHRLHTDQNYTVLACDNGTWIGEFPQCLAQCSPLESDSVFPKCLSGSREVDCSKPMMPKTTATVQCRPSYTEYPNLAEASVYKRKMSCRYNGQWTQTLPECKPVCGVSKGSALVQATVVDGKDTPLGVFPWHAALYQRVNRTGWKYICGGSLITTRVVLTAAHCVILDENDLRLAFAKYFQVWEEELDKPYPVTRNVSAISIPSEFDYAVTSFAWDIALVFLDQPIKVNSYIMPVCRSPSLHLEFDKTPKGYVVGWGKTGSGKESEVLQHNDISILSHEMCIRKIPRNVALDKFCGWKNEAPGVDKGDSGGGLTAVFNNQHHLLGIVSIKFGDVSMFTNVSWSHHDTWVENKILEFDEKITRCSGYTLQCGLSGACLERSVRCDGRRDCPDGSDEFGCPTITSNYHGSDVDNEKECRLPAQPANGRYQSLHCAPGDKRGACLEDTPGTSVPAFWLLEYSCADGYAANSTRSTRSTCESGVWSNPVECVKQCSGVDAAFTDFSCEYQGDGVSCRNAVRAGTMAVATCKPGYHRPSGNAPVRLECLTTGQWSSAVENCAPVPDQVTDGNSGSKTNSTGGMDRLQFYLGDICKDQDGKISTCQFLKDCPTAIAQLQSGQKPEMCNFDGSSVQPVVCCEKSSSDTTTRRPVTTEKPGGQIVGAISKQMCNEYAGNVFIRIPGPTVPDDVISIDSCSAIEPLITNGLNALPREYPHMALIGFGNKDSIRWLCAGSLISEKFVLTGSLCLDAGEKIGLARWVRLGEYNKETDRDEELGLSQVVDYEISERIAHPEYSPPSRSKDIALLKLSKDVEFNEYVRPACLHTEKEITKSYAVATGWGRTEWGGESSEILQKANLTITPWKQCASDWSDLMKIYNDHIIESEVICAGDIINSKDTCQGDSGGPLQLRLIAPYCMYSVIGITSIGARCGGKIPGIYTRVSHYVPWIEAVVWPSVKRI